VHFRLAKNQSYCSRVPSGRPRAWTPPLTQHLPVRRKASVGKRRETKVLRPEAEGTHKCPQVPLAAMWPWDGLVTGPPSVNFLRWVGKLPTHRRSPTRAPATLCEALLAALGSCLSIGIHANAVARAIPIRHLEIEIAGEIGVAALRAPAISRPSRLVSNHHSARAHRGRVTSWKCL
jgi:hypothetical protein